MQMYSTTTPPPPVAPHPPTDYEVGPPPPIASDIYHQHQSDGFNHNNHNSNTHDTPIDHGLQTEHQHQHQQQQQKWALPHGWKTAHRKSDGRIYYWQLSTGTTSWSHPSAILTPSERLQERPTATTTFLTAIGFIKKSEQGGVEGTTPGLDGGSGGTRRRTIGGGGYSDSPNTAYRHPDSHQCCACFSCLVFPPLGICAVVHSVLTGRRWNEGRYGESHEHSRQAYNYAWWAVAVFLGIVLWQYLVVDGNWPDFGNFFGG
mmetsp:Transcript_14859/g.17578  ORF Transcript_14859/g.17578 Transcript_14859/m.17578 type:complete len:260 (-) Transcript_14859:554-1333(-)